MSEAWEADNSANLECIKGKLTFDCGVKLDSVRLLHRYIQGMLQYSRHRLCFDVLKTKGFGLLHPSPFEKIVLSMDAPHQLQTLLQFLVTDASGISHLPYILDHLSSSCLAPSPHLQKWVTRVTSLMHSKDPATRWAAICIAYRMSFLSKSLLVDNAQSWVGIVFPSLSVC